MPFDPQGPAPLLNRAWSRRGWASPAFFGRTVPPLMAETTVAFERQATSPSTLGGWGTTGAPTAYWSPDAHVELVEAATDSLTGAAGESVPIMGVTTERHYEIFIDLPPDFDTANMPRKGDWVRFTDGIRAVHIPVMAVNLDAGLLDHLEIITDEWL
jgi:hypothetical protein